MVQNKFFSAEQVQPGIWQITNCFDSHARMNTYTYLVEGEQRAMVIDTMFGYGNLAAFCRELTDRPLVLVNTHYHGDHTGGNYDFDACYLHTLDIPFMRAALDRAQSDPTAYRTARFEQMRSAALEENREMVQPGDVCLARPMPIWPVWDGDVFDLGGKTIEVIHVGGHTPGEIVLLDRAARICFTGDACNNNTLLNLPGSISVEEYLEFLKHFKTFQSAFDTCYGGHMVYDETIIDEGIELAARIIARTDDHEDAQGFGGRACIYGALRVTGTFDRVDGQRCNIAYTEDNVYKKEKKPQIL